MSVSILLAEQDSNLRNALSFEFKKREIRVMPASNGERALEEAKKSKFDVLIANADLPGISGFDLISRLVTEKIGIPVIITTSNEELEESVAIKAGAAALLKKPFGPSTLIDLAMKVLASKKS